MVVVVIIVVVVEYGGLKEEEKKNKEKNFFTKRPSWFGSQQSTHGGLCPGSVHQTVCAYFYAGCRCQLNHGLCDYRVGCPVITKARHHGFRNPARALATGGKGSWLLVGHYRCGYCADRPDLK